MADAVGSVTKIVEVALKIKDAVDTIRQNRKDCHHIKSRVERVRHTLSLCENNAELMENSAVSAAVEALGEVLGEALKLVTDCQEETNAVCLCCTAGKLSKQLSKVDQGISNINLDVTSAILVYHISKQTQDDARPPPLLVEATAQVQCQQSVHSPQQTQDGAPPTPPEMLENTLHGAHSPLPKDFVVFSGSASLPAPLKPLHRQSFAPATDGETAGQPRTLLHQIAGVALEIRAAVETVRQNKEDCIEIDRRANRVSALLSQLENTETMKDAATRGALEKILETFRRACTLVTACQRRSIIIMCLSCPPGKLSNELREVLDQMALDLDVLIDNLPTVPTTRDALDLDVLINNLLTVPTTRD